jgi:proline iminopeptidase
MRQYFNPEKYFIVLHDQRGANRSRPFASIEDNTTWRLVEDIETLRLHLKVEKMMLLGGSWGSTLALAYAETHPERVTAMILRGIWTSTQQEIDHFYHGGTSGIFPDAYDELLQSLPDASRRPLPSYLLELLLDENPTQRKKIADAWLKYEWRISELNADVAEIDAWCAANDSYAFSLIENYYMANQCFLTEGQVWQNLDKIKQIPSIIINGRFDMPCNLTTAYRLHQVMPNSKLVIVEMAGHGGQTIMDAEANAAREFEE